MRWHLLGLLILSCTTGPLAAAEDPPFREILARLKAQSPRESLAALQVRPGFRVELVCCEPLIEDPIVIDWGPDGRLWVVEMGDYPQGPDGAGHGGRVKFLEDTDRDGTYDRATVFLDGLAFPTGVMAWRKGVLVTCAPDIFYAEDTDGDGKADHREPLYTGFLEGNPQHRINGPAWGLDNWIYAANGDSGGWIRSLRGGQQLDIHARDVRIRPDTGALDTATGMAQFGRCRDEWGNWFGGRNLQPIWHCVLPDHYLRRNPYLIPPDPCVDLTDPPTCPPVYPISSPLPRFNEFWTMNRITSACGPTIYRDDLFGTEFDHSCFICEPAHNLVYHGELQPAGVTFRCVRGAAETRTDFLASRDHWFRPTQVRTGPDGALWVVDMYRLVIEHPDYIPQQWHDQLDYGAGRQLGRIYRVVPTRGSLRPFRPLTQLTTPELVAALDQANGTLRDLIHRWLLHHPDPAAVPLLRQLVRSGHLPVARLTALCVLDGLQQVDDALLVTALEDPHPAVRRHAVRIGESLVNTRSAVQQAVLARLEDADPQVRLQLAFSLGQWDDPRAGRALARLMAQDAGDRFMAAAVLSSAVRFPGELLEGLIAEGKFDDVQLAILRNLLRIVYESGDDAVLARGLQRIAQPTSRGYAAWQFQLLADICDNLQTADETPADLQAVEHPELRAAAESVEPVFAQAAHVLADVDAPEALRSQAARLAGRDGNPAHRAQAVTALANLLTPSTPATLQETAVEQLAALEPAELTAILLEGWPHHGPELRPQILEILLSRPDWAAQLLTAMERGTIQPREVGATHRSKLILFPSTDVSLRAARLFDTTASAQRQDVIDRLRKMLDKPGDRQRGQVVFQAHCATCHQLEGKGTNIGPDLLSLTDRSTEALLVAVLDPNRALQPRYVEYSALTNQGRSFAGIVTRETGNSLSLVDAQGAEHILLRADLDELQSTGRSLMPEGMEQLFERPTDARDLIAYLQAVRPDPPSATGEPDRADQQPPPATPAVDPDRSGYFRLESAHRR